MTWPTIFANLAGGNQPLALIDAMFTQVAQMVAVPCTAAGTNALTLSPIGSAPAFTSYQNFTGARFVAGATSTAPMTAQFGALASLNVYLADGITQASTGAVLINQEYVLIFVQALNGGAGGFILESAAESTGVTVFAPNVQVFTSGTSLTYTTPTAAGRLPLYLRVRQVGGGGGGGAAITNNGATGGTTTFAGWTALGGAGGLIPGGGAGGSGGVNGTGTAIVRMAGNGGAAGSSTSAGGNANGMGGAGFWGGAGAGVVGGNAGTAGAANSGSGGGGGNQGASTNTGGGGGAGEFVEFIIPTPVAATYTYTVGTSGAGGAAGNQAGGNGAAGRIEVIAYWQ